MDGLDFIELSDIVDYHVVLDSVDLDADDVPEELTTEQGATIRITKVDGETFINSAKIESSEMASNGFFYTLDQVNSVKMKRRSFFTGNDSGKS